MELIEPAGQRRHAIRAAFPATIPVMTGYVCLGIAYGFLMSNAGYGPLWVAAVSMIVYSGSIQFVGIGLLTAPFAPVLAGLIAVMVGARHMFYALSCLDKDRDMGRVRPLLICMLTDETFSLLSALTPPPSVSERDFCFWVSLLDYSYWTIGGVLGEALGEVLTFNTTGMDFALTALFVVLFLEQWKKKENRLPGLIGLGCTLVCLAVFGADNLVIPAMILVTAVLLGGRKWLCG